MLLDWKKVLDDLYKQYNIPAGAKNSSEPNTDNSDILDYIEELKKGESYEKPKLPDTPVFDRIEFEGLDDEQIAAKAEKLLKDYYNKSINAVDGEFDSMKNKYEKDKVSAEDSYQKTKKETEQAFDSARQSIENDALKRGLARSSIAVNKIDNVNSAKADTVSGLSKQFFDAVSSLNSQIDGLSVKRQKAMNDFDISYAVKLTEKIDQLTKERDDKELEALKYNNSLTEKESEANADKIMNESDLYSEYLNQIKEENNLGGDEVINKKFYEAVYNKMDEKLSGLSGKEAREAIRNDKIFSENLSEYYYYKLYDKYGR